jgi:hypothetical protein
MSMLTMFFMAPPGELRNHKLSEGVPGAFPSVQCNYVDELKVASLENILTGRDLSESMNALTSQCVYSDGESGISVLQLGDGLVKALSLQTAQNALEPAKRWLNNNQWGRFGRRAGDLQELAEMIATIGKLAAAATASTQNLFFWVCP